MNRSGILSLVAARISLLGCAVLLGCAEVSDFELDSGLDDSAADAAVEAWPDMSPLPEGGPGPGGRKMYAHSQSELFAIDPATLKLTSVGLFGPQAPDINDMAVTPGGELYAVSKTDLYRVDAATAQLTHVTKIQGDPAPAVALTFEAKGTLLAADKAGNLIRVDPKTGQVTTIGSYGSNLGESGDLVAIADGTLYGVNDVDHKDNNQLMTIDPTTGAAQVVGSIGYPRVWGLAYWKGAIYGLTRGGELIRIDPKTGAGTHINTFSTYEFWGAAVTPLAPLQ